MFFLYLNEAPAKYGKDVNDKQEAQTLNRTLGYDREGDRLYRFKLVGNKLVEPKLIFEITAPRPSNNQGVMHHGGEVIIGSGGAVYLGIGSLEGAKYGVDSALVNVQKFTNNGKFITKWGSKGTGDGEFRFPYGIAIDSLDNVYVSGRDNSVVQKFTNDGKFITKWGSKGTGDG